MITQPCGYCGLPWPKCVCGRSIRHAVGDHYDRTKDEAEHDSERDRDPEVERRWYGVGEWVDES